MKDKMNTAYSAALIHLLKGTIYQENEKLWLTVLDHRNTMSKYFRQIGLQLFVDEQHGYAFLKEEQLEEEEEQSSALPPLLERRALTYNTTLLLVLLRKRLLDEEQRDILSMPVISEEEIVTEMSGYMPSRQDETKLRKQVITAINAVDKLGFLKEVKGYQKTYGIQRILKAKITAAEIVELLEKLKAHGGHDE
ncbi:DUF4194 domain-containing protein [Algivirga pacifica]|uniref:DUF4194 domain-containing protein n=1 Tax=Algivirga pacifica TaxID=1162670 RepID=A0ABP9DFA9_9BACT